MVWKNLRQKGIFNSVVSPSCSQVTGRWVEGANSYWQLRSDRYPIDSLVFAQWLAGVVPEIVKKVFGMFHKTQVRAGSAFNVAKFVLIASILWFATLRFRILFKTTCIKSSQQGEHLLIMGIARDGTDMISQINRI